MDARFDRLRFFFFFFVHTDPGRHLNRYEHALAHLGQRLEEKWGRGGGGFHGKLRSARAFGSRLRTLLVVTKETTGILKPEWERVLQNEAR